MTSQLLAKEVATPRRCKAFECSLQMSFYELKSKSWGNKASDYSQFTRILDFVSPKLNDEV